MFNIGSQELIIIFFFVLMLFGAKRIPEVSRQLGKGLADFRKAMRGIEDELKFEMEEPSKRTARGGTGSRAALAAKPGVGSGAEVSSASASTAALAGSSPDTAPKLEPPEGSTVQRAPEVSSTSADEPGPPESAGTGAKAAPETASSPESNTTINSPSEPPSEPPSKTPEPPPASTKPSSGRGQS